jgi:hypothetical protein
MMTCKVAALTLDDNLESHVEIIEGLLLSILEVPTEFIVAISVPFVHHVAGIGYALAKTIRACFLVPSLDRSPARADTFRRGLHPLAKRAGHLANAPGEARGWIGLLCWRQRQHQALCGAHRHRLASRSY